MFVALTRPQMFAGVTYSYFVINAVVATELFLIFRSAWVVAAAVLIHLAGALICLHWPAVSVVFPPFRLKLVFFKSIRSATRITSIYTFTPATIPSIGWTPRASETSTLAGPPTKI